MTASSVKLPTLIGGVGTPTDFATDKDGSDVHIAKHMIVKGDRSVIDPATEATVASILSALARLNGGPVSVTDNSSIIAAGGAAQSPISANTSRRYLHVGNPDPTRTLYFNMTGPATIGGAGSTALPPGASYIWENSVPTGAVSIIGAVTGQPFTVKQG